MASRRRKAVCLCHCSRSLPLSSTFLLLSAILPSSSLAQLSDPTSTNPTPAGAGNGNGNAPITFQTSVSSSATNYNFQPSPTQTQNQPLASNNNDSSNGDGIRGTSRLSFNYTYAIVGVIALILLLAIIYIGKRRRQKAAIVRLNSRAALARDVEGYRTRFGIGRAAMRRAHAGGMRVGVAPPERTEGLNEEGEAPPPYNPGSKPPSVRSTDGVRQGGRVREVEMQDIQDMTRPRPGPPGYHEQTSAGSGVNGTATEGDGVVVRPAAAVTAGPRAVSIRSFRSISENPGR
ncbi:hypothetical protein LZ554_000826 [Drepanopeziza brunnea f. sp. 'monogermtubi']|nr:hypothetical protein LZ554_000826 [Drepanopeziza brunnea f. sp. 'monogermtubi']